MKLDILAIAAHPDDLELGCGGTLAKLARDGYALGMVDLTRGEMGTRGDAATRAREAKKAAKVLGAKVRHTLDFGDGGLANGPAEEQAIADLVCEHRPQLVFTSMTEDRHPDHGRAGKLVVDACFYAGLRKRQGEDRAHRPQQVVHFFSRYTREPTFIVDISATWEVKMRAMACYESQFWTPGSSSRKGKAKGPMTSISSREFMRAIEGRARYFGAMVNVEFAEAFVTRMPPRLEDPLAVYRRYEP